MSVINKSPFPKTDKMGRKVPDGEAEFINKHEVETVVRDEKTGTASDDTFQAKNIPVTNFKRQSAMTYEQAAVDKVLRIHKNLAFDRRVDDYLNVTEEKMTAKEKEKRENIVMSMKDKEGEFKKKYGKRAKEVMYATATKMAMESIELQEIPTNNYNPNARGPAALAGDLIRRFLPDSPLNPDRNSPDNVTRRAQEREATQRGQAGFNPRQVIPAPSTASSASSTATPAQQPRRNGIPVTPPAASTATPAQQPRRNGIPVTPPAASTDTPAAMSPLPQPAAMSPLPQQSTPSPRQQSGGSALPPIPSTPAATDGGRGDRGPSGSNAPTTPPASGASAPSTTTRSRTPANPNYRGSAGAQAIQKENPNIIGNVNKIFAGQTIKVNGQDYTVKSGDTLDKIARDNPARPTTPASSGHSAPPPPTNPGQGTASPSQPAGRSLVPRSNPSPYAPRSPMNNDQSNAPIGRPSTFPTPPRDRGR